MPIRAAHEALGGHFRFKGLLPVVIGLLTRSAGLCVDSVLPRIVAVTLLWRATARADGDCALLTLLTANLDHGAVSLLFENTAISGYAAFAHYHPPFKARILRVT